MLNIKHISCLLACLLLTFISTGCGPKHAGSLRIVTEPAGAEVWLDGKPIEKVTPCIINGLSPGEHFVQLYKEDYYLLEETVNIFARKSVPLVRLLAPAKVNIRIDADGFSLEQPLQGIVNFNLKVNIENTRALHNLSVFLNNKPIALTPSQGGDHTFKLDTTVLTDGSYLLRVIASLTSGRKVEKRISIVIANKSLQLSSWTVLVYMAADNNLGKDTGLNYAERDLNELEEVGSTDEVNILVQADLYREQAKRYRIIRDNDQARVTSPPLLQLGEINTGKQEVLQDFLQWGANQYPARHYLVILWNHGTGIADEKPVPIKTRAICYDEEGGDGNQDWLTVQEVKAVLHGMSDQLGGRPVDLLITDACLMQMAEVAVEWQGLASYLVGSEETTPVDGLPYHTILQKLVLNPSYHPKQFIPELLWCYADYYQYNNPGFPWTISAVNLGVIEIGQLNMAIKRFVSAFRAETNDSIRREVKRLSQITKSYYTYPEYKDLGHFLNLISGSPLIPNSSAVHLTALAAREALRQVIMDNEVINGRNIGEDNGLAVLLPDYVADWHLYSHFYSELSFTKATGWNYLIEELLPITNY